MTCHLVLQQTDGTLPVRNLLRRIKCIFIECYKKITQTANTLSLREKTMLYAFKIMIFCAHPPRGNSSYCNKNHRTGLARCPRGSLHAGVHEVTAQLTVQGVALP